ncbi:MAG: thiamine phosphate synthase [Rhodobiaceae bacterium]|nr:thiamine phosphate synthase [Rhodobiaceae bacterium]
MKPFDLSVYGVLDPAQCSGRAPGDIALSAARGGMTLLQWRDKSGSARDQIAAVKTVRRALAGTGVPVIVNDRTDIARASGADGVHLGQDDIPPAVARAILGPDAIIGVTIRTDAEARETDLESADYVGLGGVYATSSKVNETAPIGLDGVARISALIRARKPDMPIVAIAGINAGNAADVVAAGADGVAVISALFAAGDTEAAARALSAAVSAGKTEAVQ